MNPRRHGVVPLALLMLAALSAAQAQPAPTGTPTVQATSVRIHLRLVDACRMPATAGTAACTTVHQRSDAPLAPPPQVQALTPPADGGQAPRAWQTLTF
ncbi:hypothetical protein ACIGHF_08670 [Stenotrophomonas sp. NPDC077464]|uniref:hypothetical protein n=1 Tax=unclassified Stenotrophomonas TaxID=196198 RepID=UPI0037D885D3